MLQPPAELGRGYPPLDASPRHRLSRRARKPRSWHPSPYGSDEDEDLVSRDDRRHKIKQELSRRRHHIEENSSLHDELVRLARLRESAELSLSDRSEPGAGHGRHAGGGHSVLKSIDQIMRDEGYGRRVPDTGLSYYGSPPARKLELDGRVGRKLSGSDEERSMNRLAATFNANELYYDPMPEYSSYSKPRVDAAGALSMDASRSRQTQRADDPSARKLYKGKYDRSWCH